MKIKLLDRTTYTQITETYYVEVNGIPHTYEENLNEKYKLLDFHCYADADGADITDNKEVVAEIQKFVDTL